MHIGPTTLERLARARSDLRIGLPIALEGPGGTTIAAAVETLPADRAAALAARRGAVLAITARRAETLRVQVYDDDLARIALRGEAGLEWMRAVADPSRDLTTPLKGPFVAERGGDVSAHRAALRLAKTAQLLPAMLLAPWTEGDSDDLTRITIPEVAPAGTETPVLRQVVAGRVPLRVSDAGRVLVFRPGDGSVEHYAVEIGRPDRDGAPLVRLHSACFTGDVLGSLKCDCGPQLDAALVEIGAAGGVLLYLNQEGRGIGMANKMRAYSLQDQGFDTVEANHRLGFEDDERDFRIGAGLLREMGFSRIRLMTNNPAKVAMMEAGGIGVVERVPLSVGQNPLNARYLATKARKSGHLL